MAPKGQSLTYAWSFGDNGTATSMAPTHTYTATGTYSVSLIVTDTSGQTSTATTTATIAAAPPLQPPVAVLENPCTGIVGIAINFNGSASYDLQNQPLTYAWNFGDNTTGTGVTPTHSYSAAGTYTVTLTVTDTSNLSGSASTTCTISPAPAGRWIWQAGSSTANQSGVYGTQGTPSPANTPGARWGSATWTDRSGNLWLFGGSVTTAADNNSLNDLWKFSAGQWTWVGGPNTVGQPGVYGTQGTPAPGNVPASRAGAVSWTDQSGNFWLFGGFGSDGTLNDLWRFSGGQWTWMSGSELANLRGVYGTQGLPASTNVPGGRNGAVSWIDASGNLWLFGGGGYDSTGMLGSLNDLWRFSAGVWTWVGGSSIANQPGAYGIQGTPGPNNIPGGRTGATSWNDSSGNLWLFGGYVYSAPCGGTCPVNDLWRYSAGEWTWMGGSSQPGQPGTYGTQGIAAPGNAPGARWFASGIVDSLGNFWLFGGLGIGSTSAAAANLNDLWEYSGGQWVWVSGSDSVNQPGTYGILGTASPSNTPGSRSSAAIWADPSGNLWLFGGSNLPDGNFNDLWEYHP